MITNKKKIGVCVIGAGRAGMIHAKNFNTNIAKSELVAVADPNKANLKKASKELGISKCFVSYEEALQYDQVDAVVIAAPTNLHKDIVVAAASRGKHIFCEKPMATNNDECNEMIKVIKKSKVKFQMGFMRRFDRDFVAAKESINRGDIGDVVLVKSLTHGPSIPQPWMYDIHKSNGPLAEVNSHDIDTLRWFTNSEFEEVYAIAGNYRCPQAMKRFPDFYDNVIMNARFKNGMQGVIDGAVSVKYGYDARAEVLGTKGILFTGSLKNNSVTLCNDDSKLISAVTKSWRDLFMAAYKAEDEDFIQCIIEDRQPRVSAIDGKMAVKVVEAGNASILKRRPVKITSP